VANFNSCAILDGRVECWGLGAFGQNEVPKEEEEVELVSVGIR